MRRSHAAAALVVLPALIAALAWAAAAPGAPSRLVHEPLLAELHALGPVSLEATPMSLKQIFLETVRTGGEPWPPT